MPNFGNPTSPEEPQGPDLELQVASPATSPPIRKKRISLHLRVSGQCGVQGLGLKCVRRRGGSGFRDSSEELRV